jgi:3-oxoadipate enol-lactonase
VIALMDRLELERVAYAGLSIGGMVGQWLAVHAPHRLSALVVLCSAAYLPPAQSWHERAATVREAGSAEGIADTVVGRWFTPAWAAAHHDTVARHRAMVANTDPEGYAGCCEAISGLDLRAGLPGVRVPTLVVAGAQDPSIPPEHSVAIADAIPGARLEILDPAAHVASVERADEVTRLIDDHLRG